MIHLKEFATQADYEAFVASGEMEKPNVSFVNEPYGVFYKDVIRYENGVYIQHLNGELYTGEQWTDAGFAYSEANGIALLDDKAKFVISKSATSNNVVWSPTSAVVPGVATFPNTSAAEEDYSGVENTQAIISVYTSGAAVLCANYKFPNGKDGYLPALGELKLANANRAQIDQLLGLIGGTKLSSTVYDYWSSTQVDGGSSAFVSGVKSDGSAGLNREGKQNQRPCRAFAKL